MVHWIEPTFRTQQRCTATTSYEKIGAVEVVKKRLFPWLYHVIPSLKLGHNFLLRSQKLHQIIGG
jgi:hypothetical protein